MVQQDIIETHSGDHNSTNEVEIAKDMVYIGIDQSFTGCGVVVLNAQGEMIGFSLTKTKKGEYPDMFERAHVITKNVLNVVEQYPDSFVALEGLAFGSVGNATRDLAGLQFTMVTSLRYQLNKSETIFTPTTVKSKATGKSRKITKADMIAATPVEILKQFTDSGYKKTTGLADLADAYWIARLCLDKHVPTTP